MTEGVSLNLVETPVQSHALLIVGITNVTETENVLKVVTLGSGELLVNVIRHVTTVLERSVLLMVYVLTTAKTPLEILRNNVQRSVTIQEMTEVVIQ